MADQFALCVSVLTLATSAQAVCSNGGTCSSGWDHYCDSCYLFQTQAEKHTTARGKCKDAGGQLVTIADEEENLFIQNRVTDESWIGLTIADIGNDRGCNRNNTCNRLGWMWIDGKSVVHENWLSDEPTGDSPCVRTKSGGWADLDCGQSKYYVCEKMALPSTSTTSTTATTIYPSTDTTATSTDTTTTSNTTRSTTTRIATTTSASSSSTPTGIPTTSTIVPRDSTSINNSTIPAVEDDISDREKTIYVVVAGVVAAVLIPVLAVVVIYIRRHRKSRPRPHKVNIDEDDGRHKNQRRPSDNDRLDGHTKADLTRKSKPAVNMGSGLDWDQLPEPAASSTVTDSGTTAGSRDVYTSKETTSAVSGTHSATYEYTADEADEYPDPTYSVVNTLTSDITYPKTSIGQEQHIYAKPIKRPSATPTTWDVVENDLYGT